MIYHVCCVHLIEPAKEDFQVGLRRVPFPYTAFITVMPDVIGIYCQHFDVRCAIGFLVFSCCLPML